MTPENEIIENQLNEPETGYTGFVHKSEEEKLLEDILRPHIEKLFLFTKMLRRNATLQRALISNKSEK